MILFRRYFGHITMSRAGVAGEPSPSASNPSWNHGRVSSVLRKWETNLEVNRRAKLAPLNQSLYSRALKIWNKIRVEQREEWARVASYEISRKKNWPKSIPVVFNGEPPPIYGWWRIRVRTCDSREEQSMKQQEEMCEMIGTSEGKRLELTPQTICVIVGVAGTGANRNK